MESQSRSGRAPTQRRPSRFSVLWLTRTNSLSIPILVSLLHLIGCQTAPPRPNVVLITIDTLRADALGIYGNTEGHSPFIDALAEDAVVFDDAVTPMGTTTPSHASMFTGLYPKHHGVRWNGDSLDDEFLTLAEILSERGYQTGAFVSFGTLLSHGGLDQGFVGRSVSANQDAVFLDGGEVNALARRWLDQRSDTPFFLWMHYSEPHSPYPLSAYARRVFEEAGYDGELSDGLTIKEFLALGRAEVWSPTQRWALRALYDGDVREVDRIVGEFVADLERRDLLGSTFVVLTADHGQALGEQGDVAHGFLLWQSVLQVPLVIRPPEGGTSERIATRVGLIDLTPTLLDVLGLAIPTTLDGRSVAPALSGEPLPPRRYFAEVRALGNDRTRTPADADRVAVFDGDIKATWEAGTLRVFNLEHDPRETSELEGEVGEAQRQTLLGLLRGYRDEIPDDPIDLPPEEVQQELRALGYIQ